MLSSLMLAVAFVTCPVVADIHAAADELPEVPAGAPFIADEDHDVVVVAACDLAIAFPKQTAMPAPVRVFVNTTGESFFMRSTPLKSFQIYEDWSAISAVGSPAKVAVECFDAAEVSEAVEGFFSETFTEYHRVEAMDRDRGTVCEHMGLAPRSCERMEGLRTFAVEGTKDRRIDVEGTETYVIIGKSPPYELHIWRTGGLVYSGARKDDPEGRLGVTMQLNSLAPSTPSLDLDDPHYGVFRW